MSALAADAALIEKMGTPVAAIGCDALVKTVGQAMARNHGYTDYPFVIVPGYHGMAYTHEKVQSDVEIAMPQIEKALSPQVAV